MNEMLALPLSNLKGSTQMKSVLDTSILSLFKPAETQWACDQRPNDDLTLMPCKLRGILNVYMVKYLQ